MGLPVTMLPPTEAALRIWTPAKYLSCSSIAVKVDVWCAGSAATSSFSASPSLVSVTEAPTSMHDPDTCGMTPALQPLRFRVFEHLLFLIQFVNCILNQT